MISIYDTGLKILLLRGLSEPEFYGDLVYKFRKNVGKPDFSDRFSNIVIVYKRKGYNTEVTKQSNCFAVNPISVDHIACLFNCTPVGRGSISMMARFTIH